MEMARIVTGAAAAGAGLSAGVYLAFSAFVMPGLRRLPPPQAITAMNAINEAAPRSPLLMTVLFGTAALCLALFVMVVRDHHNATNWWSVAGALLYLISVLILVFYHVPHNNALMAVDPHTATADDIWSRFYTAWTAWNHLRTVTAGAGSIGLLLALRGC